MSDSDVLVNLMPYSPGNDPAHIVGLIRNILGLGIGDIAECTIEGFKGGLTIHGQNEGMSFRWSIHDDGQSYLKAWGMRPTETWDFLETRKRRLK